MLTHSVIAMLLVFGLGRVVFGNLMWPVASPRETFLFGLIVSYLVSVVLTAVRVGPDRTVPLATLGIAIVIAFGTYFALLWGTGFYSIPLIFLIAVLCFGVLIILSIRLSLQLQKVLTLVALPVALVLLVLGERPKAYVSSLLQAPVQAQRSSRTIDTTYHAIHTNYYDHYFDTCQPGTKDCVAPRNGGGLEIFADGYLIATGEGQLFFAQIDPRDGELKVNRLPFTIPLDATEFAKDGREEFLWKFRVTDILVKAHGERFELFAAYHVWNNDARCFAFNVASIESETASFLKAAATPAWQTIYETKPCVPLAADQSYFGDESGGRLAALGEHELLLTVGDFSRDGLVGDRNLAQDDGDYGKTLLIDTASKTGQLFTKGHRNPQGLFVAPDGAIWQTEHGPRGGDELNLLVRHRNYGWPVATYGTHSRLHNWPLSTNQGEQEGYEKPVFAWLPDIGISNLTTVGGQRFPLWQGDLLIASYKKILTRIRIRDGRVAYAEPIEIRRQNARIRDVLEDRDGRIVMWMDRGAIAVLDSVIEDKKLTTGPGNDNMRGELLFAACLTCHSVNDGTAHAVGPDLFDVVGRSIATASNYPFSDAMKAKSGAWSVTELDRFLQSPQTYAPGTSMEFVGMPNEKDRAKLIQYLETLK